MSVELRREVADLIEKYLVGEESLDSLKLWENAHITALRSVTDPDLKRITGTMAAAPWLVIDGVVTEAELREELAEALRTLRSKAA